MTDDAVLIHGWTDGYVTGGFNRALGGDFDGDGANEAWLGTWGSGYGYHLHEGPIPPDGALGYTGQDAERWCPLEYGNADSWTLEGAAGDLDGDGEDEITYLARGHGGTPEYNPGTYILGLGSADCARTRILGEDTSEDMGGDRTVIPGDVDGDGGDDLLTGTTDNVYIVASSALPEAHERRLDEVGQRWSGRLDYGEGREWVVSPCAAVPGDVNGDGYDDWLLCADRVFDAEASTGELFYIAGGPGPLTGKHDSTEAAGSFRLPDETRNIRSRASDLDGDGARELVVETEEGMSILRGPTSFPALHEEPAHALHVTGDDGAVRWLVTDGGRDVDGDGLEDVAVLNVGDDKRFVVGIYAGWTIPWNEPIWW